jgi:hypothetical protein
MLRYSRNKRLPISDVGIDDMERRTWLILLVGASGANNIGDNFGADILRNSLLVVSE